MNAIKEYYNNLEQREKNLVIVAALMLAILIPYQFIWKPFVTSYDDTSIRLQAQKKQFFKMQQQAQQIRQLRGAGSLQAPSGRQFLSNAINTAARQNGLASALNIKSDSNNNLRVSLDNVPFDNVMNWLDQLIVRNGVIVNKFTVDRQPTVGRVNVSVYLDSP